MTFAECEIVADAGARLDELRQRLNDPANLTDRQMRDLALDVSKVYGLLSSLPLETEVALAPELSQTAWLVERGQSEHHEPTVWYVSRFEANPHGRWTENANEATRFIDRGDAEAQVLALSAHISQPTARVTEHVFVAHPVPDDEAEAETRR